MPKQAPEDTLDLLFLSLSDRTRRNILARLLSQSLSISAIAEPYEMSLPAISKHLAILQRAHLIEIEKKGRTRFASLQIENLFPAFLWLETFEGECPSWAKLEDLIFNLSS